MPGQHQGYLVFPSSPVEPTGRQRNELAVVLQPITLSAVLRKRRHDHRVQSRVDLPPSLLRLRSILVLWVGLVKLLETIQRIGLGRPFPRLGFSFRSPTSSEPVSPVWTCSLGSLVVLWWLSDGSGATVAPRCVVSCTPLRRGLHPVTSSFAPGATVAPVPSRGRTPSAGDPGARCKRQRLPGFHGE